MIFGLLLLSCALNDTPPPQAIVDQNAYLKAVEAKRPESSLAICSQISDERLRGECVLFAAKAQAMQKRPALAFCNQAPTISWQSACAFEVSDMAGLTGKEADKACQMAGEFQSRCMYHALQREESSLNQAYPLGQEKDLMYAILSRMESLNAKMIEGDPLHITLTARIISRRFQAAWISDKDLTFDRSICGTASPDVCTEAYRLTVKMLSHNRPPEPCQTPMSAEIVAQSGLPLWSPEFEVWAQEAWANVCRRATGSHRPPDHRASSGTP